MNNQNNYNEERKKNNYYNNKGNDLYNNEYDVYNEYNNQYNDYAEYNQYNEYNEYNNGYNNNNYIYPVQNKKKKVHNKYNNNFYDNNEEVVNKTVNEKKNKKEVMRVKINIKEDKFKELIIYKDDDVIEVVKQFCNDNFIDEKLVNPLCNKIKKSLSEIDLVTNQVKLSRDSVLMLEKAKNLLKKNN
jgi:hypothetical protein